MRIGDTIGPSREPAPEVRPEIISSSLAAHWKSSPLTFFLDVKPFCLHTFQYSLGVGGRYSIVPAKVVN